MNAAPWWRFCGNKQATTSRYVHNGTISELWKQKFCLVSLLYVHHKWFTILCFSFEMKTYQLLSQDHILIKSFSTPLLVCSTSVFILIWTIWADSCSSQSETLLSRAPHDDLKVWSSYLESRLSISFMEVGQMLSEQKNVERNVWSACLCN